MCFYASLLIPACTRRSQWQRGAKSQVCLDHSVFLEMPLPRETKEKLQHYNGSSSDRVILFVSRLQNARKDQVTNCSLIPTEGSDSEYFSGKSGCAAAKLTAPH